MTKQAKVTVKFFNVTVKFFNAEEGYGFFQCPEGQDIFVHLTDLTSFGFTPEDMVNGSPAIIDYEANGDQKRTADIHYIAGK